MPTIEKFRVVYCVGLYTSPARPTFSKYSPSLDTLGIMAVANAIAGVTMTLAQEDEAVAVMRGGYMRGIGSADIDGWEPDVGDALWCGSDGKPTTTKPTKGALVFVGTYLGSGVVEVELQVIPGLAGLSFVKNDETLLHDAGLLWDTSEAAFIPQPVQAADEKGQPNGYAGLDANAFVEADQLGDGTADATTFLRGDNEWTDRIAAIRVGAVQQDDGLQLIGPQIQGWGAPTGTATRTAFATGSVTLSSLAEAVKALIDDLTTHGLIGPDLVVTATIGPGATMYAPTVAHA